MYEIVKDILDYYRKSEQYGRQECLCLPHNEIILTSDYPYYNIGIRGVYINTDENLFDCTSNIYVTLDLSFIHHFSLSHLICSSRFIYLFISNDFNLSHLVLDLNVYYLVDYIYFNIDMSSHKLINSKGNPLYLDSSLYMNWLNSGLSLELSSYYVVCSLRYSESDDLSFFYDNFNLFYSLNSKHIGVNLKLYVENCSELYDFIGNLRKVLKSNYKKDNSIIYFKLIVNSFDYTVRGSKIDLESLFVPLFDDFTLRLLVIR